MPSTTDRDWKKWGKRNPYRGVLGIDSSNMNQSEVEAAFFNTGEIHIATTLNTLVEHFGPLPNMDSALDFGCGVGRLLLPLSRRFKNVTGVDISPDMIQIARERTNNNPNIDYVDKLSALASDRLYDFVHSYIVIQHIRSSQGYPIISSLIDRVAPGGYFALHMTIADLRLGRRLLNGLRYRIPMLHWIYNLSRRRPWDEPITEMNRYDLTKVLNIMQGRYDDALVLNVFERNGHVSVMVYGKRL